MEVNQAACYGSVGQQGWLMEEWQKKRLPNLSSMDKEKSWGEIVSVLNIPAKCRNC